MDLEAPRIPVVSSKEATDVSLMRTQSHLTYLNLSMNARQHVKTSKKHPLLWKAVTLWGRGLWQLEPGAWFWFWDVPLGSKHVLGLYSLSISNNSYRRLSNSLLWVGFKDRVEADLWASVIRWVSWRIAMLSASLISLGLAIASFNRRRMSGSGRASMNCSRAYIHHTLVSCGVFLSGQFQTELVRELFLYFTFP